MTERAIRITAGKSPPFGGLFEARGDLRPALRKAVEAGAEDDILTHPTAGVFDDHVLDEARTRHDRGTKRPRELRIHVAALVPVRARCKQLQANLIVQHMRRRIDRDVQGAP